VDEEVGQRGVVDRDVLLGAVLALHAALRVRRLRDLQALHAAGLARELRLGRAHHSGKSSSMAGNSAIDAHGRLAPLFFEGFFPCSLTGTITHIVVGNLAPLHILW
jgi:hypothetical protein